MANLLVVCVHPKQPAEKLDQITVLVNRLMGVLYTIFILYPMLYAPHQFSCLLPEAVLLPA